VVNNGRGKGEYKRALCIQEVTTAGMNYTLKGVQGGWANDRRRDWLAEAKKNMINLGNEVFGGWTKGRARKRLC